MNQALSFCLPVGSSKDCICTSSSLTTPPTPSLIIALVTVAGDEAAAASGDRVLDGSPVRPPQRRTPMARTASGMGVAETPPRAMAIASISSMKPIAPPSARAALRSALKYERILRAVAP